MDALNAAPVALFVMIIATSRGNILAAVMASCLNSVDGCGESSALREEEILLKPVKHVFVCVQNRPPTHPRSSCAQKGSQDILQAFWAESQRRGVQDIAVSFSGCLGPCDIGPNVIVYPDGVLYSGVKIEDVSVIFEKHLIGGQVVESLRAPPEVWG